MFLLAFDVQAAFSSRQTSLHSNINSPIPGEFIVVLNSPSEQALYESSAPLPYSSAFTIGKTFQAYLYKNVNASTLAVLRKHPYVDYAESNGMVHATDVQKSPPSWGLKRVSQRTLPFADEYIYPSSAGEGARVYIVDTGIYLQHQDFGGRAELGVTINTDGGDADCNGHGTHVAGTVGGTQYGVAKLATLVHVKVLDCGGSGAFSDVIEGIDWAVKDNAARSSKITTGVINLSLGGYTSQALNDAVDAAFDEGILSVVAAGNNNFADACIFSPGSASTAFTVAAAEIDDKPARFTNLGPCVNLWAPGVSINSCWIGSDTASRTMSGTSMSAPHVAGVAALLLAESDSAISPSEVATEITELTTPDQIDYRRKAWEQTFANESRISRSSFPNKACKDDNDCSRSQKCCAYPEPGQCISSTNTCCGNVVGGCWLSSTCCPGQFGDPHCTPPSSVCCGDFTCGRNVHICCKSEKGDRCCGSIETCEPLDGHCSNPWLEQTPNLNLFNGLDVVNNTFISS